MRVLIGILIAILLATGLGISYFVLTIDAPVHFGWLFLDYPNPNGHGLKGVIVSTPELLMKCGAAVACFALTAKLCKLNDKKQ